MNNILVKWKEDERQYIEQAVAKWQGQVQVIPLGKCSIEVIEPLVIEAATIEEVKGDLSL